MINADATQPPLFVLSSKAHEHFKRNDFEGLKQLLLSGAEGLGPRELVQRGVTLVMRGAQVSMCYLQAAKLPEQVALLKRLLQDPDLGLAPDDATSWVEQQDASSHGDSVAPREYQIHRPFMSKLADHSNQLHAQLAVDIGVAATGANISFGASAHSGEDKFRRLVSFSPAASLLLQVAQWSNLLHERTQVRSLLAERMQMLEVLLAGGAKIELGVEVTNPAAMLLFDSKWRADACDELYGLTRRLVANGHMDPNECVQETIHPASTSKLRSQKSRAVRPLVMAMESLNHHGFAALLDSGADLVASLKGLLLQAGNLTGEASDVEPDASNAVDITMKFMCFDIADPAEAAVSNAALMRWSMAANSAFESTTTPAAIEPLSTDTATSTRRHRNL